MYVNNTLVSHHSYSLIHSAVIGELSVCAGLCLHGGQWHEWDERQDRKGLETSLSPPYARKAEKENYGKGTCTKSALLQPARGDPTIREQHPNCFLVMPTLGPPGHPGLNLLFNSVPR